MDNLHGKGPFAMPQEYLQKIITDPPRRCIDSPLDGLICLPKAIHSLLQTFPMPWEVNKKVICYYDANGLIHSIKGVHTDSPLEYYCSWMYSAIHACKEAEENRKKIKERKKQKWTVNEYIFLQSKILYTFPDTLIYKEKKNMFPLLYGTDKYKNKVLPKHPSTLLFSTNSLPSTKTASREDISFFPSNRSNTPSKYFGKCNNNEKPISIPISNHKNIYKYPEQVKKEFSTNIEWTKLAKLFLLLSNRILNYVLEERKIRYLAVTETGKIKKKRKVTTKERKKSRLGQSFHILCESLKLIAQLVTALEENTDTDRMKRVFEIFSSVGKVTGIYRYKYSSIQQIKRASHVQKMLLRSKGPASLIWCELWRIWVLFFRGTAPLLSSRLSQYVQRRRSGRVKHKKPITAQRQDSSRDIKCRKELLDHAAKIQLPDKSKISIAEEKRLLSTFQKAWKQWKADISIQNASSLVLEHVEKRGLIWAEEALSNWKRIALGRETDKKKMQRVQGRMLRIYMKMQRRDNLPDMLWDLDNIDSTSKEDAKNNSNNYSNNSNYSILIDKVQKNLSFAADKLSLSLYSEEVLSSILFNAIIELEKRYTIRQQLKKKEQEELAYLTRCKITLTQTLSDIQKNIRKKHVFSLFSLNMLEDKVIYNTKIEEQLVDLFLEHLFRWFAHNSGLLNACMLPIDEEPLPVSLMSVGENIKRYLNSIFNQAPKSVYLSTVDFSSLVEDVEIPLLLSFLSLVLSDEIVSYLSARLPAVISYKDMEYVQKKGIFQGFEFAPFLIQYYIICISTCIIDQPLSFLSKNNVLSADLSDKLNIDANTNNTYAVKGYTVLGYIGYIMHTEIKERTEVFYCQRPLVPSPSSLANLVIDNHISFQFGRFLIETKLEKKCIHKKICSCNNICSGSNCSCKQKHILISNLHPFTRRSTLNISCTEIYSYPFSLDMQDLCIYITNHSVSLHTQPQAILHFKQRIMQIVQDAIGSSFFSIVRRWNSLLLRTVLLFREAISKEFAEIIITAEKKIQMQIMKIINSRVKKRYPKYLFHAEKESGGLNLLSAQALITCTSSWKIEVEQSDDAYSYISSYLENVSEDLYDSKIISALSSLSAQGIQIHTTGIPRLSLLHNTSNALSYERGWRARRYIKAGNRRWTEEAHDGRWISWSVYRKYLPSIHYDFVCRNTLYPAACQKWISKRNTSNYNNEVFTKNKIDMDRSASLIGQVKTVEKKRTKAQSGDLARLPNRMFTLWWSPAINRETLNVGHPSLVENTCISMYGKLSSLRTSYTKMFSDCLWGKIHKEIISSVFYILNRNTLKMNIYSVQINDLAEHSPETYMLPRNRDSGDKSLLSTQTVCPSLLVHAEEYKKPIWCLVRMRWGNADSIPLEKEAEMWINEALLLSSDISGFYSCTGFVVLVDLCRCEYLCASSCSSAQPFADAVEKDLLSAIPFLNAVKILQRRVRHLVGFNQLLSADSTLIEDPQEMLKYPNAVYMCMKDYSVYALDVSTGKYLAHKEKRKCTVTKIFDRFFQSLDSYLHVQHIFAEEKLCSLIANSGKAYLMHKISFSLSLDMLTNTSGVLYAKWRNISVYTSLCRAALILRHAQDIDTQSLDLFNIDISDSLWIERENNMMYNLCTAAAKKMGITDALMIDPLFAQDTYKRLVFCKNDTIFAFFPSSVCRSELGISGWRERYACWRMITPHILNNSQNNSISSYYISFQILETVCSISDTLFPVFGFLLSNTDKVDALLIPAQKFKQKRFRIVEEIEVCNFSFPYSIIGIIYTRTLFSKGLPIMYKRPVHISLPESLLCIEIDIETGKCISGIYTKEIKDDNIQLNLQNNISLCVTDRLPIYFTSSTWNRNLSSIHSSSSYINPSFPRPFYSEEFRMDNFCTEIRKE